MAKIQYIKSSSIQFEGADTSSSIGKPKQSTSDPSLRIMLTIGIVGVLLAVFASIMAIAATQTRKDADAQLKKVFDQRINHSVSYLARTLRPEALINYRNAMKAISAEYEEGNRSSKIFHTYIQVVWSQLISKQVTRALCVSFLREAEVLTDEPLLAVTIALKYFERAEDAAVVTGVVETESDELFPLMNLDDNPGSYETEEEEVPDYSVD